MKICRQFGLSKAVVLVLFLVWVALWCLLRVVSCCHALLFFLVFLVLLSFVITSLGEEIADLCVSRAFVCLFCTHQFLSFFSSFCLWHYLNFTIFFSIFQQNLIIVNITAHF